MSGPEVRDGAAGDATGGSRGLFVPDGPTWRVHSEPLLGLAAMRALLLQALHPAYDASLRDHARHGSDPWYRLEQLQRYVAIVTFGDTPRALTAAARLRALHARVRGRTPNGHPYSADDPQLLAWAHSCLVASFLELTTRGGLRLSGAEQDDYLREQVRAAMLVGLEPDEVPQDRHELRDYFRAIRPVLQCSATTRRTAEIVTDPADAASRTLDDCDPATDPLAVERAVWAPVAGLAYAALPPWARRLYGLTDLVGPAALDDAATTAGLRSLRELMG